MPATEKSMASPLFTPSRHIGVSYVVRETRYNAAFGVFKAAENADHNELAASARFTFSALKDEGGVNPSENIIASKRNDIQRLHILALEAAWLDGPL